MSKGKTDPLHLVIYSSENNNIYFNLAFSCYECLLEEEESGALAFQQRLNAFSTDDVSALSGELQLLNSKTIGLDEHKTIILVCVLYFICHAFLNDKEEAILTRLAGQPSEELLELRNQFLHFASYIVSFAKPHFASRPRFTSIIRWFEENEI